MDLYVGVDLGGTNLHAAIAGADGRIVVERSVPTLSHEGPSGVLTRMAQLVDALAEAAGQRPVACGVGVPGLLDLAAGTTRSSCRICPRTGATCPCGTCWPRRSAVRCTC